MVRLGLLGETINAIQDGQIRFLGDTIKAIQNDQITGTYTIPFRVEIPSQNWYHWDFKCLEGVYVYVLTYTQVCMEFTGGNIKAFV